MFAVRENSSTRCCVQYVQFVCRLDVEEATGNEYVLQNTFWKYAFCFTGAIKIVLSCGSLSNIPEVLKLQFYAGYVLFG